MGQTLRTFCNTCILGCIWLAVLLLPARAATAQNGAGIPHSRTLAFPFDPAAATAFAPSDSIFHLPATGAGPDAVNTIQADSAVLQITEILINPSGDTNGDGIYSSREDAFVEIVNTSSVRADLGGWQLAAGPDAGAGYIFPAGTILQPGRAIVIFGGGRPAGGFGAAVVRAAPGGLPLNGVALSLRDRAAKVVDTVSLRGLNTDGDGQSYARRDRAPDGFRLHPRVSGSDGRPHSPGTRPDGTSYGLGDAAYAQALRGGQGWRLVAAPTRNTTFAELLEPLWTQGMDGSDAPAEEPANASLYRWNEGYTPRPVPTMDAEMRPGEGYFVYVFEDDDQRRQGVQGGFPKTLGTSHPENRSPVSVPVRSVDVNRDGLINYAEGYSLLGNPFGVPVSPAAMLEAFGAVSSSINAHILVWEPEAGNGNGRFRALDSESEQWIAPYQGFVIRYMRGDVRGEAVLRRQELAAAERGRPAGDRVPQELQLRLRGADNRYDVFELGFRDAAETGVDRYDAYKLFSLNEDALNIFSPVARGHYLSRSIIPPLEELQGELRIPLGLKVSSEGDFILEWDELTALPPDIELYLVDRQTDRRVDLRSDRAYRFSSDISSESSRDRQQGEPAGTLEEHLRQMTGQADSPGARTNRFELLLVASSPSGTPQTQAAEKVTMSPNYPNPFSNQTSIDLELQQNMHVTVTIWNIVGQKVATLADRVMEAGGPYQLSWNAPPNMPSGIYICKVEAGGKVLTRKMTLVK